MLLAINRGADIFLKKMVGRQSGPDSTRGCKDVEAIRMVNTESPIIALKWRNG